MPEYGAVRAACAKGAPDSAFAMHREYRVPLAVFRALAAKEAPLVADEEIRRGGDLVYRVKTAFSRDVVSRKLTR